MVNKSDRARQFMPFDAMKGLQKALRDREEWHSRVEKREISEDMIEKNSSVLAHVVKGATVLIEYYCSFHDVIKEGVITSFNPSFRFLKLNDEKILFEDIYEIKITDLPK